MMLTVVVYVGYLQVRARHNKLDVGQPLAATLVTPRRASSTGAAGHAA